MHTHIFTPARADRIRNRIQLRCGCWRAAEVCAPCSERMDQHRAALQASFAGKGEHPGDLPIPGCESCYRGLKLPRFVAKCCCLKPRAERCTGCVDTPRGVHVCLVETPEEIDHALWVATGAPLGTAGTSAATKQKVAAMEQATQLRAPRLHDR